MDPKTQACLEVQLMEAVTTMLTEGDRDYLRALSRRALGEVIEQEVRFLGLYATEDPDVPQRIHVWVDQHLDQWRAAYLSQAVVPSSPLPS